VHFIGLDLAWGQRNRTGVAVVDADGRLREVGAAVTDDDIAAAVSPWIDGACVVGIDAPLIVSNPSGYRLGETLYNRDFAPFQAIAQPSNTANPLFAPPRALRLATRWGLDTDPGSGADRLALEVYPHAATIALFGRGRILKYKRRNRDVAHRRTELLTLVELVEGLRDADPPLRVQDHPGWRSLRDGVEGATRASHLNACEDPVDSVLCAYVARFFACRPADVTVYGDHDAGYIVTPSLPPGLRPTPRGRG
jgi:predicted RNase H-like nuclease